MKMMRQILAYFIKMMRQILAFFQNKNILGHSYFEPYVIRIKYILALSRTNNRNFMLNFLLQIDSSYGGRVKLVRNVLVRDTVSYE